MQAAATAESTSAPAPAQSTQPAAPAPATGGAALLSGGTQTAPAAQPAGQQSQTTTAPAQPAGNDNWRNSFADGLDDDTRKVWDNVAGRYTSQQEFAKAHVSLVRSMDKRIAVPDENAKPEEWDSVFNKLGRPETPDKYQIEFPQDAPWDDTHKAHIKSLTPLFHKAGATQRQVNEFVKQQAELDKVAQDAFKAKANTTSQQYDKQMQAEWRSDYERNQKLAGTTVKHYAGADTETMAGLQLADGTYVLDHPAMRRMLAKIGTERAEDDRDPSVFNTGQRANTQSQIDQIYAEMKEKGITPSDPRFPHAKIEDLMKKVHGSRNDYGRQSFM